MRILISNDDSVHARGIHFLKEELKKLGKVWVVAPLEEKSTTGHSLTLHKPLRLISLGKDIYGVSGSPADCVYVGIREVLRGMPDLVVSGINRGGNMGQDVYYSGTVSAAREACILGIPSLAVSLNVDFAKLKNEDSLLYASAAKIAREVIQKIMALPSPYHSFWNLNVPNLPRAKIKGVQLARQGFRHYSGNIIKRVDHRGKPYYWVGGQYKGFQIFQFLELLRIQQDGQMLPV
jgi:5'-nucleotidase